MDDLCIKCRIIVSDNDAAVDCDKCGNWQHIACDTGITKAAYNRANRRRTPLTFVCQACSTNDVHVLHSTLVDESPTRTAPCNPTFELDVSMPDSDTSTSCAASDAITTPFDVTRADPYAVFEELNSLSVARQKNIGTMG
ncbi:uncharacterized protein LOC132724443, partial [Ruditapes philippinarum]|uniref:uncharacterized protein LOC132724443 n=1 Tax=Ruditapes philippinarum TaxID=129788 RepID=UPI00295AE333